MKTKFNLRFTATDDRALDYVTINIPGIDGFDNRRVDADGKSSLNFAEIIVFPNEPKSCNVTITAFDKKKKLNHYHQCIEYLRNAGFSQNVSGRCGNCRRTE